MWFDCRLIGARPVEMETNLSLVYTRMTAGNLHSVESILLPYLERDWDRAFIDRFLDWRFLQRKNCQTVLAMDGDRCVAMVDAITRNYAIGGKKTGVRETDYWLSLAEYRPFASMRVMQSLMDEPEPICAIAGYDYVGSLMERLRWNPLPDVRQMVLPLSAGFGVKVLAQATNKNIADFPAFLTKPLSLKFRKPKKQPAPATTTAVSQITNAADLPDIMPPPAMYAAAALADRHDFEWYAAAPDELGEFVWLLFSMDGKPVAFTLCRLYTEGPYKVAKLVHVQSAITDVQTYAWIIGETSAFIAKRGVDWIDGRFSCPTITKALSQAGYIKGQTHHPFYWPGSQDMQVGDYLVSFMLRGEGLAPYPL